MARIARMGTYAQIMCVLGSTSCQKKNKGRISMKMAVHDSHLVKTTIAAALLVAMAQPGFGERLNYKPVTVKTPDGLTISAQEWGNPAGPEILFIHGFSQSHLSWMRQVGSDLAKEFRIVTYDLRGHGNSDKPLDAARYRDSKAWGDEVQAVIDTAGLKRPVLVGWSYAGRVISDYLATHGAGQLAGINFVDAPIKVDPALIGDNLKNLPLMASEDLVTNITATRAFLHGCFSRQPSADDYETMLAFNMMVLPKVRAGLGGRPLDASHMMSKLKLPVLVTHGAEDRNAKVGAGQYTASIIPGAKLSIYEGIGHSPFYEDAPRFNTELAAFVRAAAKTN
ncbi:MAG: alpha/beta hydrolase [Alphaproteobacteria bacterium]|nr:MAG: alpha/beta hydrolase [Alphaproteobacteria bacterium]